MVKRWVIITRIFGRIALIVGPLAGNGTTTALAAAPPAAANFLNDWTITTFVALGALCAAAFAVWRGRALGRVNTALRNSQQQLLTMIATSPDGIIMIATDGTIESINPAAVAMFGYDAAEIIGENVKILMPEPYQSNHDGNIARYLETGEKRIIGIGREVTGRYKDGTTFPMELAVGEIKTDGKQKFTGFIRDISQRRLAEDELRASRDSLRELQSEFVHVSRLSAMGEMAAALAHELNQPLAAMMNYTQATRRMLSSNPSADPGRLTELMTKAVAQANRAGEIIRRLRSFVSHEDSEHKFSDINEIVADACALAMVGDLSEGVARSTAFAEDLPPVLMDRIQIQQVVVNLIRNSLDATIDQDERTITIATARGADGAVEVSVADNGPGLDKEIEERLFQPFNSSKMDGMGIGLSISRTIIDQHGGRIWATPGEGGGVIFSFTLPVD